jgi:primosomal protein N' (replication factor Y)
MAVRGLRLKSEIVAATPGAPSNFVASVWVDSGVYHLDQSYSYLIPQKLLPELEVGSSVVVPFNGRELPAVVISIDESEENLSLKSIVKKVGKYPLLTGELINLISLAAKRYAAHPFDLIRFATPTRVAAIENEPISVAKKVQPQVAGQRRYLQLPASRDKWSLLSEQVEKSAKGGNVLVVVPEAKDLSELQSALHSREITTVVLDSSLGKSERYRNYLMALNQEHSVVIGTRSAIFAPVNNLAALYIYNEGSEHFYEQRTPGWNVRDIALLRIHQENFNLYFCGYSPSTEIARLIDEEWIEYKRVRSKISVEQYEQAHGELIPSRALKSIKNALSKGPVLIIVPQKGYAQAIRCSHCKTISRCSCGGAHIKTSATAPITCAHCSTAYPMWKCSWCSNPTPALISRGIDRHQHEIGLLIPGVLIHISTSDHRLDSKVTSGIVLATPSMAPRSESGYAAVVIVEGNRFLNQPDMRASERVREMYFASAALVQEGGTCILIQDHGHPIVTALTSWNPSMATHQDLQERLELSLPPYVRVATVSMDSSEIVRLKSSLQKAIDESRLPSHTRILGPINNGEKTTLILTVPVSDGHLLIETLHEFMRRRSAAKKALPALRIDPYSLSH